MLSMTGAFLAYFFASKHCDQLPAGGCNFALPFT